MLQRYYHSGKIDEKSLAIPTQQVETPSNMKRPSQHASEGEPSRKKTHTCIDQYIDTEIIRNGKMLTDCHVGLLSNYLNNNFHTLIVFILQVNLTLGVQKPLTNQLQVIHSRGNHRILASNIGCTNGDVNYDSVYTYSSVDKATIAIITQLFQSSAVEIVKSPKQKGGTD